MPMFLNDKDPHNKVLSDLHLTTLPYGDHVYQFTVLPSKLSKLVPRKTSINLVSFGHYLRYFLMQRTVYFNHLKT